jgi:hypothetical protein
VIFAIVVAFGVVALSGALPASAATTASSTAASSTTASSTTGVRGSIAPAADKTWFGPDLDWGDDAPDGYQGRLGATPSMYELDVDYPLVGSAQKELLRSARAAAAQGAVLVVSLEPGKSLKSLTTGEAKQANALFEEIHTQYKTQILVRFAPEMNGTWVKWGQQPTAFVKDFRTLAKAVHAGSSKALMVWSPSYGAGYPFGESAGRLKSVSATDLKKLDTNHDGKLTDADSPYAPYYPGAKYVDWVGQSMFYFGKGKATEAAGRSVPLTKNQAPAPDEVAQRFAEKWGYAASQSSTFYDTYAKGDDKPMLLDTGALYVHSLSGAAELTVKQGWWRQVLAELPTHPMIEGVTWLETNRAEPEAGGRTADWRETATPGVAGSFRTDLQKTAGTVFGPVTREITPQEGSAATDQQLDTGGDQMAWIVWIAAGLAVVFLLCGLIGKVLPSWSYTDDGSSGRDLRLDLFRGFIILAVVITHVELGGPYSYITLHGTGAITGAEMFVFLSGLVLGMVYPRGVRKFGEWASAVGSFKRVRKQYLVTLGVIVVVFALTFVPFLNAASVTTFTDRGTGLGGVAAKGRIYDLYPNAHQLLAYPPPWFAVKQFLLLEMGPWPFNIMGLFVVLSIAVPFVMWALRRKLWWLVLVVSWALYVFQALDPKFSPLPSQFDAVFPLLTWQVVFAHGLVLGYYRGPIFRALTSRLGKVLLALGVVGYAGFLVYVWAGFHLHFTPTPFPASLYDQLYNTAYQRIDLQWGRLADIAFFAVVAYAFLTVFWKPVNAALGWFWIPLGQASLYVFVWQVFFVLAIASIPGIAYQNFWVGTVLHTAMMLLLWVMVKRRFLFSVIPR